TQNIDRFRQEVRVPVRLVQSSATITTPVASLAILPEPVVASAPAETSPVLEDDRPKVIFEYN
ncbi:MAG: hypothetical protein Q7R85_04345, partial [bacterium]|nr:hypothetical protein [bacterium]